MKDIKITKEMILEDELPTVGSICPSFKKNGIKLSYYGGNLVTIKINGEDIEELFNIRGAKNADDDLVYRITDEALDYVVDQLNKEEKIKVLLAPTVEFAKEIVADATVEAEYGEICIEGKTATLAHHGSRANNPAPCNADVTPLDKGTILVSHIDLDTVGGVLALMGKKPEDTEFWKGAEFIDVNGVHHIHELPTEVQNKLNSVHAWSETKERKRITEVTDVTESILEWLEILEPVLGSNPDPEWIAKGKKWEEETTQVVESKLVSETETVRAFITDGVFCSAGYYSPNLQKVCKATVVLNTKFNAITVAFADGGKEHSAREIVQSLWGELAGGRDGIAGSPRNWDISTEEVEREFYKTIEKVEQIVGGK